MGNASKLTSIQKRKRLEALYARGEYVCFGPNGVKPKDAEPAEDDIRIWVGPPSPLQREMSIREATASRNRAVLNAKRNDADSFIVNASVFVAGLADEDLIEYILDLDDADRLSRARREVLLQKEWEDFNALRDAMRQFEEAGEPREDPEWAPLLERDQQFGQAVDAEYNTLREGDREGMKLIPRHEQEKRAIDKRVEQQGSALFMKTYEDSMLWYACRDDEDHSVLFFDAVPDLRSMPEEVQEALANMLATYINEAAEAKNSQAAGSGSPSSEPVKEPETSPVSSPDESIGF
jgi:hypothetical protein